MWEVYAYQNSESLSGIFNAVAAIMGSATYLSAVAAVTFCGFVAALLAYTFAPEKLQGWKWLATVVLVCGVLFVPKVTVGIVDKTGSAPVTVIDNVPLGAAMFGGLTSSIGNTLTELLETAFQVIPGPGSLPAEFTYQKNGLMFGNRLIRDTRSVSIPDPGVRTDLVNFIANCTMYDLIDGTLNPADFARSSDVWPLMGTPNPARFTTLTGDAGVTNAPCPEVYNSLSRRLPAQITLVQGRLAFQLNPTLPAAAAQSAIAGQIQQAYIRNRIASASATAADLVRQNAIINAINDSSQLTGQKINDPASMVLAVGRAQAVAQQNAAWLNGGKIAEQALPVVRNVVEAMTYALFPFFVLLLFLTSGRETVMAVRSYVTVLIWIQLWPPLYAILNYMAAIYAQYDLAAAAEVGNGVKALSLQTASPIYANAISAEAVVGYLVASIPFIAWSAVKRMETFGTAMVGGLPGLQATIGAAATAAATGNVGLGNVTMDQRVVSPSASNPWVSRQQAANGDWLTSDGTGRTAVSKLRNEGLSSRTVSVRVSEQDVEAASRSADSARSEAISAARDQSAVLADVYSRAASRNDARQSSTGSTASSSGETAAEVSRLDGIISNLSRTTGVDRSQVAQIAFAAAVKGGVYGEYQLSSKVGTPDFLPASVRARVSGGGQLSFDMSANAGKSYASKLSDAEQKVLSQLTNEQVGEFKRFSDRVTRDQSLVHSLSSDAREARDLSSRLATTTSRADRAEAAFAQRLAYAQEIRSSYEKGESFSIDLAQDPRFVDLHGQVAGWIREYGQDSQALSVLMGSELARRASMPNKVFTDGTAVPDSFESVRAAHGRDAALPGFDQDIGRHRSVNDAEARRAPISAPGHEPASLRADPSSAVPPTLREEVRARAAQVRSGNAGQTSSFEQRNEITRSDSGVPGTRKSLMLDASKQVAEDGANTVDNAKEIVDKLKDRWNAWRRKP